MCGQDTSPLLNEIDWEDDYYLTLLMTIEEEIVGVDNKFPDLDDYAVIFALEKMANNPEIRSDDPVVKAIQMGLRILLSLSDYSRYEVKRTIRKVLYSAKK
ncbi:hypothetical protein DRP53_05575, partial [candidate division WOR-3 bacterium]